MNTEKILSICQKYEERLIEIRRDLHKHPEIAWTEFRTTAFLAKELEKAGYKIKLGTDVVYPPAIFLPPTEEETKKAIERAISEGADPDYIARMNGYTGVCAELDTGKEGPTIAYRFDIDCINVVEEATAGHFPFDNGFCSIHEGETHSCGHDGHATIGLGVAWALMELKEELTGKIILIFQPAEEGVRGGKAVVEAKVLDGVEYFFSGHLAFAAQKNDLVYTGVTGFLATSKFDIEVHGTPAHAGASPEMGNNAILAASAIVLNLHTFCQDGRGSARINVGVIQGGTGRNVVPAHASLKIETRGATSEIDKRLADLTSQVVKNCCEMYGCGYEIKPAGGAICATSGEAISKLVGKVSKEIYPHVQIVEECSLGGSEDVSYMMEAVNQQGGQATFTMFGAEIAAPHHSGNFDFDESAICRSVAIHTGCALEVCQKYLNDSN